MLHLSLRLEVKKSENYWAKTNKSGPDPNFKIQNGGDGEDRAQTP